jgi:hypothetical protein
MVGLSACPYIPIYKFVSQTKSHDLVKYSGLQITPLDLFYGSRKGVATCSVGLRLNNQGDSSQTVIFSNSHLINLADTLKMQKIWSLGVSFETDHVFILPSKKDTVLGFYFKDLKKNFGDTVKFVLEMQGIENAIFIYKKVRS